MARYKLTIEYDGTPFAGWQRQHGQPSVQAALEDAIARLGEEGATLSGAGRTDAGVHALGQVAHVDLQKEWTPDKLMGAINAQVRPDPVSVLDVALVDEDFHARFSATARYYRFRILDRRPPPALDRNRVWWVPHALQAQAMHDAAQTLVGHHDFTTFRSAQCQSKSPVKTLDRLDVVREGAEVVIYASARSFLHNQVRSLVGTLKLAGEGKWSAADVRAALDAADRSACGPVAPPDGLYLVKVDY
ncbi:MAG: tRNA pseudouridine(38-40) synthase TruA [Anderseniella sp.]|jgi:tRNA pseudouridine38-40 synthase|nr:tRNA pseudouridine(38-40) synthase TruA [Anderseniella sp.]